MNTLITILCIVAVIVLFGIDQQHHRKNATRLDRCEHEREILAQRITRLEARCPLPTCPVREDTKGSA